MKPPTTFTAFAPSEIPVLETNRLRLRAHRISDLDPLAAMWARGATARFTGGQTRSRHLVWKQVMQMIGSWGLLGYGFWLIEDKASGVFIGEGGLMEGQRDMTPPIAGTPEAGWVIDTPHWGKGYASEAITAMLGWSDSHLKTALTCIIDEGNDASVRLATKSGFVRREDAILNDTAIMVYKRAAPR